MILLIAQKPDVDIFHSNDPDVSIQAEDNSFEVDEGRAFEVLCLSSGEYRGTVTWTKRNSENKGVILL